MKDTKIAYNRQSDCLYINWATEEQIIKDSEEITPGIVLDYDQEDKIVGIEILGLKLIIEKDVQLLAEQYLKLSEEKPARGIDKANQALELSRLLQLIGAENIHLIMDVEKEWDLLVGNEDDKNNAD